MAITRNGPERVKHSGVTKNISSGGVLFTTDKQLELGGSIEYVITLGGLPPHAVSLRCIGKILRYNKIHDSEHTQFAVAATLERYEFMRVDGLNG